MSHYANELQKVTAFIHEENFDKVLNDIKNTVATKRWLGFGWRENVLNARTLEDFTNEFAIKLVDEGNGYFRPVIKNVYVSTFFEDLIYIIAPYMTNGEIVVDDEYNNVTITFDDGKVRVARE